MRDGHLVCHHPQCAGGGWAQLYPSVDASQAGCKNTLPHIIPCTRHLDKNVCVLVCVIF